MHLHLTFSCSCTGRDRVAPNERALWEAGLALIKLGEEVQCSSTVYLASAHRLSFSVPQMPSSVPGRTGQAPARCGSQNPGDCSCKEHDPAQDPRPVKAASAMYEAVPASNFTPPIRCTEHAIAFNTIYKPRRSLWHMSALVANLLRCFPFFLSDR